MTTPQNYSVDVAVYDATSGGVMAAVAAARHGASVLMICASWPSCFQEGGFRIGGMSSGGLGETDIGSCGYQVGGLGREFYSANRNRYKTLVEEEEVEERLQSTGPSDANSCRLPRAGCNVTFNLEPHGALEIFEKLVHDAGVKVLYGLQLERVEREGRRIQRLHLTDGSAVAAKVFVEAGYEGDLIKRAGASYTVGREAASQYNESLGGRQARNAGHEFARAVDPFDASGKLLPLVTALPADGRPGDADDRVQAYNFRLCVTNRSSNRLPFARPAGYDAARWELLRRSRSPQSVATPTANMGAVPNGKYDANNAGPISTDFVGGSSSYPEASYAQRRAIWTAHREYTEGLLYTLATDPELPTRLDPRWGYCADEFNATGGFPPALYVRAARRLRGDRVFTQNTPREQQMQMQMQQEEEEEAAEAGGGDGIGALSIGIGCYNFDSHTAERVACPSKAACFGAAPPDAPPGSAYAWNEGDVETAPPTYQIPFWVAVPKAAELSNLLTVSTPSASHVGMSTLRMEPQFMVIGHSIGVAAAQAAADGADVQALDMQKLHAALLEDGQILSTAGRTAGTAAGDAPRRRLAPAPGRVDALRHAGAT